MKIIITGRHFDVSDELKKYAEKKFSKLEKYFHKLMDIQITMYMEKHNHVIEAVIKADGSRFYGIEKSTDMYPSIDLLVKSLEKQAVKHKEKHSGHKAVALNKMDQVNAPAEGDIPLSFIQVSDKPKDEIEAFLEMKVEDSDFLMFNKYDKKAELDYSQDNYALIYRCEDCFKMVEMPDSDNKNKKVDAKNLKEFDIVIIDDSITKPEIKFTQCSDNNIKAMTVDNALKEVTESSKGFIPFLNSDTNNLNIICKTGDSFEVITPQ